MPIGSQFNIEIKATENTPAFLITNIVLKGNINEKRRAFLNSATDEYLNLFSDYLDATFIPIQQPVSFMEAIANEYNRVRVDLTGLNFYSKAKENLNKYMSVKEMFKALYMHFSDYGISQAIKEGKWYIEESEADSNE